jgi:excisionase family DNA binding protein
MALEQTNMFGPPEAVDREAMRGRCDWAPAPWERENLWPKRLVDAAGAQACEALWGDVPRLTRLQTEQVCRRLACDSNTVYRLIEGGELDAVNIGAGSQNATWRVYRYSLIWFLFRREFLGGADTRSAALANIGREAARKLAALADEVRREASGSWR